VCRDEGRVRWDGAHPINRVATASCKVSCTVTPAIAMRINSCLPAGSNGSTDQAVCIRRQSAQRALRFGAPTAELHTNRIENAMTLIMISRSALTTHPALLNCILPRERDRRAGCLEITPQNPAVATFIHPRSFL
jgi:hypothetical protein